MTQEDKELLLKDLCARLPYGVIVSTLKGNGHLCSINQTIFGNEYGVNIKATKRDYFNDNECDIKPYLRPLSSMTKEEDKEWQYYKNAIVESCDERLEERISKLHDWFAAHHLDFRGLIPKGLAIEAPEEMYK